MNIWTHLLRLAVSLLDPDLVLVCIVVDDPRLSLLIAMTSAFMLMFRRLLAMAAR